MNNYKLTLKHEDSNTTVSVFADSQLEAIKNVMKTENIPIESIEHIELTKDSEITMNSEIKSKPAKGGTTYKGKVLYCLKCNKPTMKHHRGRGFMCLHCGAGTTINDFSLTPMQEDRTGDFIRWNVEDLIEYILDIGDPGSYEEKDLENKTREELIDICKEI